MSIRDLPKIELGVVAAAAIELSANALAHFDETVQPSAGNDDSTISVYGPIGEDIFGEGLTVKRISGILRSIGNKDVTVAINSPGGNMFEGLAIYNALREHPAKVTVHVIGVAASAASLIAMAGDEIKVAKAGFLMIHNAQIPDGGNRHDKREIADKLEQFDSAMAGLYADRTGLPKASIATMMDDETFLSGEESVAKKFADGLLPADAVKHAPKAELTPLRRAEAAFANAGMTRAERRALLKEITATPSAGDDDATPGAGDAAVDDGSTGLSLALARLKLMRA
jgi:ATP-dependent Clp protease protease subunit